MPAAVHTLCGRCHCGNVEIAFTTRTPPAKLQLRACACSFCSRHGARCVSDPGGEVRVTVRDPSAILRYRFALETADFLVCGRCGIYLGAMLTAEDHRRLAIVNVNVLDDVAPFMRAPLAVSYDAEDESRRRARRAERWTPVAAFADADGRAL